MSKLIFLNISWANNYRSINGGKFVNDRGTLYDCYNFFPMNHFCYGYAELGNKLNLERVDKIAETADAVQDVTIIWVADRKIIGWYEHAEIFRYWQNFSSTNNTNWDYICRAREENVFLIPPEKRNFDVPTAAKNGAGKGMGNLNIWYADTDWAQEIFVPAVEKYLESLRGKIPIEYLTAADINQKISATNLTEEKLFLEGAKNLDAGYYLDALNIFNYLIYNAEKSYNVVRAKYRRGVTLEKIFLYDEAVESYKRAIYEFNRLEDAEKESPLDLDCMFNLARIYEVMNKKSLAYPLWQKLFEVETDMKFRCDVLIRMMWDCEFEQDWDKLKELLKIYDGLNTTEFVDDVKELKKIMRKAKQLQKSKKLR